MATQERRRLDMDIDMPALLSTPMPEPLVLSPTDLDAILSTAPFLSIPSCINIRSLPAPIKPCYAIRTGTLEFLNEEGRRGLLELGVKRVFDLRSKKERNGAPTLDIEGVENSWLDSVFVNDEEARGTSEDGEITLGKMYIGLLESHANIYGAVLEHVRDRPQEPFLFHCTGGKDRTGVLAALLLAIADLAATKPGSSGNITDIIKHDYTLTRIGIEPGREMLTKKLFGGKPIEYDNPKMKVLAGVPPEAMNELFGGLAERYGGVKGYVTGRLSMSEDDVLLIAKHLVSE